MTLNLAFLDISTFRNLSSVQIKPIENGFNVIYGSNGSGKTSLLEAIYYLSLGRSFRSSRLERVIQVSADRLSIFARLIQQDNKMISIGIQRNIHTDLKIRIEGKDVYSIAELAHLLPVQILDCHCHHLIDAGPVFRRKYVDWGVFYYNNDFLLLWKQFQRALKQRNAALRNRMPYKEIDIWTEELIQYAELLEQLRSNYLQQLIPLLENLIVELLNLTELKINYYRGWDTAKTYRDCLCQAFSRDMELGYTQFGPHKADLKLTIKGIPAKDILSRGQQKLFVCGMILARGMLLKQCANKSPIYLVDDLPSELDKVSRINLMTLLAKQNAQIFVTAIECINENNFLTKNPVKMFHVEQGRVKEVNC